MEKRYLIPLSDRIESINILNEDDDVFRRKVNDTIRFGKQPVKLGMFIPCDLEGNVLEEPICYGVGDEQYFGSRMDEYQEAQERVLFKGCTFEEEDFVDGFCGYLEFKGVHILSVMTEDNKLVFEIEEDVYISTLEDLTHLKLELTDNALKG